MNKLAQEHEMQAIEISYDRWASDYDETQKDDAFIQHVYDVLTWDTIERYLPPAGDESLDAGGGTGRWTIPLAQRGYRVVLSDISQGMLDIAAVKLADLGLSGQVSLVKADVCNMEMLPDERFGLVLAEGDVLSYCRDPVLALSELARLVKPGGHVIASVDSRYSMAMWLLTHGRFEKARELLATGNLTWHEDAAESFPVHHYTATELRQMFTGAGLITEHLVGKPVLGNRLHPDDWRLAPPDWMPVLSDPERLAVWLALQRQYATEPGWQGAAPHLEIVGRKP